MDCIVTKASATELMIGIPNILTAKRTRSETVIQDHLDENGPWRNEYTQEGVVLITAIRRLKPVRAIHVSSQHTMEITIYFGFSMDETVAGVRRIFDGWEPTTPIR